MNEYFTVSYEPVDSAADTSDHTPMVYAERIRGKRGDRWYDFGVIPTSHFKDSLLAWISGVHSEVGDKWMASGPTGDPPVCTGHTCQPVFVPESQAKALLDEAKIRLEAVTQEMREADSASSERRDYSDSGGRE